MRGLLLVYECCVLNSNCIVVFIYMNIHSFIKQCIIRIA